MSRKHIELDPTNLIDVIDACKCIENYLLNSCNKYPMKTEFCTIFNCDDSMRSEIKLYQAKLNVSEIRHDVENQLKSIEDYNHSYR